jgi:hypothetical protein
MALTDFNSDEDNFIKADNVRLSQFQPQYSGLVSKDF